MKIDNTITWISTNNEVTSLQFFNDPIADEIESYAHLPIGWTFGNGIPAIDKTVLNAKNVYLICKINQFGVEPHPNEDGTITLIAFIKDNFLEIDINETQFTRVRYAVGRGNQYRILFDNKIVRLNEIEYELTEMLRTCKLNVLSESSISKRTAKNNNDSAETRYSLNEIPAYRFSVRDVPRQSAQVAVHT